MVVGNCIHVNGYAVGMHR